MMRLIGSVTGSALTVDTTGPNVTPPPTSQVFKLGGTGSQNRKLILQSFQGSGLSVSMWLQEPVTLRWFLPVTTITISGNYTNAAAVITDLPNLNGYTVYFGVSANTDCKCFGWDYA